MLDWGALVPRMTPLYKIARRSQSPNSGFHAAGDAAFFSVLLDQCPSMSCRRTAAARAAVLISNLRRPKCGAPWWPLAQRKRSARSWPCHRHVLVIDRAAASAGNLVHERLGSHEPVPLEISDRVNKAHPLDISPRDCRKNSHLVEPSD